MNKDKDEVGLTGPSYELADVYSSRQLFELVEVDEDTPPEEERKTEFSWNWRLIQTIATEQTAERYENSDAIPKGLLIEVNLGLRVGPSSSASYRAETQLVGRFLCVRPDEEWPNDLPPLHTFASLHAVSVLIPYLRQRMSDISGQGPHDEFYLPVLNVHDLMEPFEIEESVGWKGLKELPDLAAAFGVPINALE